jgi:hypothetical protein
LQESQEAGAKLAVAGGDATELFKLVEEALDVVALAVESLCPAEALVSPDHVGNVGNGASCLDVGSQAIGVVGLVGDDDGAFGQDWPAEVRRRSGRGPGQG